MGTQAVTTWLKSMLALVVLSVMLGSAFTASAATPFEAKVKAAMAAMKEESAKLGPAKAEGGVLYFGTTKINDNYALVDSLKGKFGGTATFFIKQGESFMRVSTNVMKDGKRAVGTPLDPSGPAMAAMRQGKAFYGIVDILGKMYDTGYEPIINPAGEVVGIYYVGHLME